MAKKGWPLSGKTRQIDTAATRDSARGPRKVDKQSSGAAGCSKLATSARVRQKEIERERERERESTVRTSEVIERAWKRKK